ncbi:MAG: hypothetical protein ACJATI_004908 [Halioglobus sp.]|jgi:hypothetical protein
MQKHLFMTPTQASENLSIKTSSLSRKGLHKDVLSARKSMSTT